MRCALCKSSSFPGSCAGAPRPCVPEFAGYDGLLVYLTDDEQPAPYAAESAGVLTPEIVAHALDELWNPPVPLPPGGYRGGREPFGTVPVTVKPPEWTVETDGYRLVIRDGAMIGLEYGG